MKGSPGITICEIFGPTVQGEGPLIGLPTVFVRTGGCDYRCRWCDTAYAVDGAFRGDWRTLSAEEILAEVRRLSGGQPLTVTLSGGNPALQPLAGLLELGRASGYRFAMETQGSIVQPWFADLAVLTLSPKPPSSGMATDWQKLADCVASAGKAALSLKLVVEDEDDYQYARRVAAQFPSLPVTLQPCNIIKPGTAEQAAHEDDGDLDRLRRLVARVLEDRWYGARVLPQLHVLLWGNKRGR
ncbi:MAG: 7-carboxy-7-deazaguanine synthase QueE [Desulforhopalus sp.]|nr:7-carboxy-7-deazaguanine synthase QueE [Desulforhopalus sp.]